MHVLWQNILRTVMAGTDRHPVPNQVLNALGLEASEEAPATALRAMPAAHLLRRAAAPIGAISGASWPPCPPDDRPFCSPAAVQPLVAMLRYNAYPEVLPEYFELLHQRGQQLPPEFIPEALDQLARKKQFTPAIRAALGPIGIWLAGQNPAWVDLGKLALPDNENLEDLQADWQAGVLDLAQYDGQLETPDSDLVQMLLKGDYWWPKPLLHHLLEYPLRNEHPRHWSPPKHLLRLLQRAALRCRPSDIFDVAPPDSDWPYSWHSALVQFRGVVQFRQKMWRAFE
jgi:hypothetical protein